MSILESIKTAIKSISSNKMRSFLTMLGIIIGISSVITITSIGNGSQSKISNEFGNIQKNSITIRQNYNGDASNKIELKLDDLKLIKKHKDVLYAAPSASNWSGFAAKLRKPGETKNVSIYGIDGDYRYVNRMNFVHGRSVAEIDNNSKSKVVIIDEALSQKVFGKSNSLGEKLTIKSENTFVTLTVIGILKSESMMFAGLSDYEFPATIYIPINLLKVIDGDKFALEGISISLKNEEKMEQTGKEIVSLLERKNNAKESYYIDNPQKSFDEFKKILNSITLFISFVAAISLLVGGIGVMNIMLVTVTERTREIGIRKSLGARNKDILTQFLIESVILTLIGGFIGISLGYLFGYIVGIFIKVTPIVSIKTVILTFSVSTLIGIIFGVYPANKAAKLDPIEALRYE